MPERATPGNRWSEKSAEAVIVTRESDEGLNGGKSEAPASLEGGMRQSDEASTAGHGIARSGNPSGASCGSCYDLNPPNRRMRTRMSGGVAGGIPYAD